MSWALAAFQYIGAFLGFVSTGITLFNYLTKERPTAVVVGRATGGFGRRESYLKVRNRSDRPLLLHLEGGRHRSEMTVWPDHETRSAIYAILPGTKTTITVEPNSDCLLPLVKPGNFDAIDSESQMIATVNWSFAQPLFFRPKRPLRVSIQKAAFEAVVAGVLRETGGDAD